MTVSGCNDLTGKNLAFCRSDSHLGEVVAYES